MSDLAAASACSAPSSRAEFCGCLGDAFGVQTEVVEDPACRPRGRKGVRDPESCDKGRVGAGDDLGDCAAQASVREPFLNGHNSLGLLGGRNDGILVDRLDGAKGEDPGLYALGSQYLSGRERMVQNGAVGGDGDVASLAEGVRLARREGEVVGVDGGDLHAGDPDVLLGHERIGISSWSATLLATVNRMRDSRRQVADSVIQVIGGVGEAQAQVQATHLTEQLAEMTGAKPVFLPAPGFVSSPGLRQAILEEPYVKQASEAWRDLSILLAGIGSLEPSPLLRQSGNAIPQEDQADLLRLNAIGDVCLRFFDENGQAVDSKIDDRIVGIPTDLLRSVPRRIGVAGGVRKHSAIRAALRGEWVNVLVTDTGTAEALLN